MCVYFDFVIEISGKITGLECTKSSFFRLYVLKSSEFKVF